MQVLHSEPSYLQALETQLQPPGATPLLGDDAEVLLVPLEAPRVAVTEDGGLESFLRLLGLQGGGEAERLAPGPADYYDSSPLKFFSSVMDFQPEVQDPAPLQEPPGDGVVLLRVGRGLKSVQEDSSASRTSLLEVRRDLNREGRRAKATDRKD